MTANEQKLRKGWEKEIEFRHSEREQAQRDLDTLRSENAKLRKLLNGLVRDIDTAASLNEFVIGAKSERLEVARAVLKAAQ